VKLQRPPVPTSAAPVAPGSELRLLPHVRYGWMPRRPSLSSGELLKMTRLENTANQDGPAHHQRSPTVSGSEEQGRFAPSLEEQSSRAGCSEAESGLASTPISTPSAAPTPHHLQTAGLVTTLPVQANGHPRRVANQAAPGRTPRGRNGQRTCMRCATTRWGGRTAGCKVDHCNQCPGRHAGAKAASDLS